MVASPGCLLSPHPKAKGQGQAAAGSVLPACQGHFCSVELLAYGNEALGSGLGKTEGFGPFFVKGLAIAVVGEVWSLVHHAAEGDLQLCMAW